MAMWHCLWTSLLLSLYFIWICAQETLILRKLWHDSLFIYLSRSAVISLTTTYQIGLCFFFAELRSLFDQKSDTDRRRTNAWNELRQKWLCTSILLKNKQRQTWYLSRILIDMNTLFIYKLMRFIFWILFIC